MNKTNTPTPEEAGAATSSVTKFQCKDSENQRHEQSSELNSRSEERRVGKEC